MDATTTFLYFGSKQVIVYQNPLNIVRTQTKLFNNKFIERDNLWIKPKFRLVKIKAHFSGTHFDGKFPTFGVASCIMVPA